MSNTTFDTAFEKTFLIQIFGLLSDVVSYVLFDVKNDVVFKVRFVEWET